MTQKNSRKVIHILINGKEHQIEAENAFLPLAQYLRYQAHAPGTKIVCAEGDCGACTVLIAKWHGDSWNSFKIVNSCIAPVYLFDLSSVVTVEGLTADDQFSEVQEQMRLHHGAQCGYCTPGIVCALSGLAEASAQKQFPITEKKARNYLTGNLCRCTGYDPIITAAVNMDLRQWNPLSLRYLPEEKKEIFKQLSTENIHIQTSNKEISIPTDLDHALSIKASNQKTRIVAGATDLGVLHNKGRSFLDYTLVLNHLPESTKIENRDTGLWVGASVTLTEFEEMTALTHPELSRLLKIFASPQIKNQATLLGNIINGSPIGDTIPALLVYNSEIHLISKMGLRVVPLNSFYKSYKTVDMQTEEIAIGIHIPKLSDSWITKFYKVSLRKDLDISAVTFAIALKQENQKILEARVALGGVMATVIRLTDLEQELQGQMITPQLFAEAGRKARSLIKPLSDLRASSDYRLQVSENLFNKFYEEISSGEVL